MSHPSSKEETESFAWAVCDEHETTFTYGTECPKCELEDELTLIAHGYHESGGVGE